MVEKLKNKTNYYVKILHRDGVAMVATGKAIPVEEVRDCELLDLDLTTWKIEEN